MSELGTNDMAELEDSVVKFDELLKRACEIAKRMPTEDYQRLSRNARLLANFALLSHG